VNRNCSSTTSALAKISTRRFTHGPANPLVLLAVEDEEDEDEDEEEEEEEDDDVEEEEEEEEEEEKSAPQFFKVG
jgi:hypothetical protein